jgi:hypothetical protein
MHGSYHVAACIVQRLAWPGQPVYVLGQDASQHDMYALYKSRYALYVYQRGIKGARIKACKHAGLQVPCMHTAVGNQQHM